jgi:hypothetical protein
MCYLDGPLANALNSVMVAVIGRSIQHLCNVYARQRPMVVGGKHAEVCVHRQDPRLKEVLRTHMFQAILSQFSLGESCFQAFKNCYLDGLSLKIRAEANAELFQAVCAS